MGSEPLFTEKPECNPTKAELKQDLGEIRDMMVVIMEKINALEIKLSNLN